MYKGGAKYLFSTWEERWLQTKIDHTTEEKGQWQLANEQPWEEIFRTERSGEIKERNTLRNTFFFILLANKCSVSGSTIICKQSYSYCK
jgi:hypothetical protein